MPSGQRLKLRDGSRLIDAEFSVSMRESGAFEIVLESSGGATRGSRARNSEYPEGLAELLRRVTPIAASLDDCLVASRIARDLPEAERRVKPLLPYGYPIMLSANEDFEKLRLALTSPQGDIASKAKRGGNERKRIALRFSARHDGLTEAGIVAGLGAEPTDAPTGDDQVENSPVTNREIDTAQDEWRRFGATAFHEKYKTTPSANIVIADPDGTEYDARAIVVAAHEMAGLGADVGRLREDSEVLLMLQALGYVVEDLNLEDQERSHRREKDRQRAIQRARSFAGQTDAKTERKVRREQRLLREALGLGSGEHACTLCGRVYPDRFLVAAHIKKRSECTQAERTDIPAIAMIACAFGCDALFEHGYVFVDADGTIKPTKRAVASDGHLRIAVAGLDGRKVIAFDAESAPYFEWHRVQHGFISCE